MTPTNADAQRTALMRALACANGCTRKDADEECAKCARLVDAFEQSVERATLAGLTTPSPEAVKGGTCPHDSLDEAFGCARCQAPVSPNIEAAAKAIQEADICARCDRSADMLVSAGIPLRVWAHRESRECVECAKLQARAAAPYLGDTALVAKHKEWVEARRASLAAIGRNAKPVVMTELYRREVAAVLALEAYPLPEDK